MSFVIGSLGLSVSFVIGSSDKEVLIGWLDCLCPFVIDSSDKEKRW